MPEKYEQLIEDHAPILWFHPEEAFLPEDCKVMVERGDLYKKGETRQKVKGFNKTLDDLANYSSKYYLKLPEIDMRDFLVPAEHQIFGIGPDAVAKLAKMLYANNPSFKIDPPFEIRDTHLKYYARVGDISITKDMGLSMDKMAWIGEEQKTQKLFGDYIVIQYFFFYIFNDSWNKHVGDWDSTIQILIKKDNQNEKYAIYSMHETNWFVKLGKSSNDLRRWIKTDWNTKRSGTAYTIRSHPFGFVAKGAHGVYPTPGLTFYGLKVPISDDFSVLTDERVIDYTCILPNGMDEKILKNLLAETTPPIDNSNLKPQWWDSCEIIDKQRWLKYKGLWGEDTGLKGWDGPEGPNRDRWKLDSDTIRERIIESTKGYKKGFIFKKWDSIP